MSNVPFTKYHRLSLQLISSGILIPTIVQIPLGTYLQFPCLLPFYWWDKTLPLIKFSSQRIPTSTQVAKCGWWKHTTTWPVSLSLHIYQPQEGFSPLLQSSHVSVVHSLSLSETIRSHLLPAPPTFNTSSHCSDSPCAEKAEVMNTEFL